MGDLTFVLPGDPETLTGGYHYDRRICAGLRAAGWTVDLQCLPEGFPFPDAAARAVSAAILAALPADRCVVIDGLALGALPELAEAHSQHLRLVALVHHPLAEETGLSDEQAAQLFASESCALAQVQRVIVTSPATARGLERYGVAGNRITVVVPGCDPAPLAEGSNDGRIHLLCVATLTARKGHALLFQALARHRHRPWHLTCVGGQDRDPQTTQDLLRLIEDLDLGDRVGLIDALPPEALSQHYQAADALILASYHEGYGMVLAEALAHGLPIVSTTAGAIVETVPATAGLLVPAGDLEALTAALERFFEEPALRARLAEGARQARERLPTWPEAVSDFAAVLRSVRL